MTHLNINLKHNTEQTVGGNDQKTLWKVARGNARRGNACLQEGGGHFQHLL